MQPYGQARPVLRTGVDIVSVERIARVLAQPHGRLRDRTWTQTEQQRCAGRPESFAARWAAKEATMKALGRGIGEVAFTDIEVETTGSGAPVLRLHATAASAAETLGNLTWSLSLSHDSGLAIAFVVAVGLVEADE